MAAIHLGWLLPTTSSDLPEELAPDQHLQPVKTAPLLIWSCFGWGFPSQPVTGLLVSSYLAFSPLPSLVAKRLGGMFSVALSVGFPRLAVSQYPIL